MTAHDRLARALSDRYSIERELGAGGMATVYLAYDLKHDRRVAVKVLKPELAAVLGADRFLVEIKTTAALQHPHILPLFDSGEADGFLFYVMPFIDGETLRSKLDRETQLGVDEAVKIASDVADALHYAHTQGVVHRDIKPENILLANGRPMVADFGIALAVSAAAGGRMTETGLSLGTPHYMSPEQATAEKEISARSDIYSLASVLYEMLAGQPPHLGGSAQQIIMKIIAEPVDPVTRYRKSVPPNVAAALAVALEKLPADRFASAEAFAQALADRVWTAPGASPHASVPTPGGWRSHAAIPALVLAGVLGATTVWALTRAAPPPPLSRYAVTLPEGRGVGPTQWSPMAVSPDGSRLVYVGESGSLFVRSRDDLEPVELQGTAGAFNPFFSPDGTRVGYFSGPAGQADLRVVSLTGGPPVTVTSTGVGGPGASWGADGFIYFDASGVAPLWRIPETGGTAEAVSELDSLSGELQHNWPDALPNGRGVLMTISRGGPGINVTGSDDVGILDLSTRRHRPLLRAVYARYAASGHVVYVTAEGDLMAAPFDQDRLELAGVPVPLLEGINIRSGGGGVDVALSRSGTLWYGSATSIGTREAVWIDRAGAVTPVDPGWTGDFEALALSPDGARLAIAILGASGTQIWVKQVDRTPGALSKLTHERDNSRPRWHEDGTRVAFASSYVAETDLRSVRADGGGEPTILASALTVLTGGWTRDGRWVIYHGRSGSLGAFREDIFGFRPGVDSVSVPLVATPFNERNASVSPDGRWLLYEANPTGSYEVYVRPFPDTDASLTQVSTAGGTDPKWSRDGREIFFASGASRLVATPVLPGESFAVGRPVDLFSLAGVTDWDVDPAAGRFVVIRQVAAAEEGQLVVVENFFEELRRKVPR